MSPAETIDLLLQRAGTLPAAAWSGAAAALLASYLLRAARLQAEWQPRTGASLRDCLRLFLLHNIAVVWLPMRSGEAGYPLWLQRRWQVPLQESLPSLLWLRLQDALVLALLGALALTLTTLAALPALAALGAGAALMLALAGPVEQALERQLQRWPQPAATAAPRTRRGRWHAALRARRGGRRAWRLCIGNWAIKLATLALLLEALGGAGPGGSAAALRGVLAGEWAGVLPLQAPGGLGSYEAAVWAGAGAPQPAALALGAVLQLHALSLALATLGGALAAIDTGMTGSTT
ncbi:MAG: lysylphosphatidylglycerol synthase domain-containing protein [Sphaerotilus natans subsp. sulfidivorans]|uniref:lysylphosphatidylglycerol synthase domain-containing protein n=1 Tax=Sphaerotilus sulfidivorans TaxID=639200 RepID=UPI0023571E0B|nr:lysylphosphatidylglycerol synthase domain-containing protein [Sphaerotilus sulfidivorans]MCK6402369.1 lysylphosphatidylglycerol synthase domain-containing protein [Sphaerotilus sulfidivorans]